MEEDILIELAKFVELESNLINVKPILLNRHIKTDDVYSFYFYSNGVPEHTIFLQNMINFIKM